MWRRTSFNLLKQGITAGIRGNGSFRSRLDGCFCGGPRLFSSFYCTSADAAVAAGRRDDDDDNNRKGSVIGNGNGNGNGNRNGNEISYGEAKRLMRLVNVEALKMKLGTESREVIGYKELLEACESMGVAKSPDEASAFARVLDEAGVILLFRDKVYLHPDKVVDLVRKAVPLVLLPEDDPCKDEMKKLEEKKEQIDRLAHKQVRRILWTGLGLAVIQVSLFFRLTFWEFSWDVMEPIAFFTTATGIVVGYAYFLFTSRDPTYQDFMERLFLSRQRKLIKKFNFDIEKFKELQNKCKSPLDVPTAAKHRMGAQADPANLLHDH